MKSTPNVKGALLMFIKQLKHDLMFSRNAFFGMGALLLGVSYFLTRGDVSFGDDTSAGTLFAIIFTVTLVIVATASIFQLFTFYRRNMFGNSGYLMFTLPVSRSTLLASKLVTSLIWINFMLLVSFVMTMIAGFNNGAFDMPDGYYHVMFFGYDLVLGLIRGFLFFNAIALLLVATTYFGITLANSSIGRWRIGVFIAGVAGVLYLVLAFRVTFDLIRVLSSTSMFITSGIYAAFAAGAIAATLYLLKKRVNLQ